MKKHKVKKVKGIKVVTEIEGKKDREKILAAVRAAREEEH